MMYQPTRTTYRLIFDWYSIASLADEDEVIEIHRFCRAIEPLMKRFDSGYVNKIIVTDEGPAIEIVCVDVEYVLETIAPVMSCFPIVSEGFPSGGRPSAYYTIISCDGEQPKEVEIDLGKYVGNDSEDGASLDDLIDKAIASVPESGPDHGNLS